MQITLTPTNWRRNEAFITLITIAFAFVVGIAACILPAMVTVAFALAIIFIALLYTKPWYCIAPLVFFSMIAPDFKISDVLTIGGFLILGLATLQERRFPKNVIEALPKFYLSFLAAAIISTILGLIYFNNGIPAIYRDGRNFVYWLWVPAILFFLPFSSIKKIKHLQIIFLAIGLLIATTAIIQSVTGIRLSGVGKIADLENTSGIVSGVTRVQMPGYLFVIFSITWFFVAINTKKIQLWLGLPIILIFIIALLVNFGRALWFWTAISIALSTIFIGKEHAFKYIASLALAVTLFGGMAYLLKPDTVINVAERIASVKDEGGRGTSYGWRMWENQDGFAKLIKSPIVGIGMGGEFRAWLRTLNVFEEHTRYIHNSYLYIALKIGIPGLILMLLLVFSIWINVLKMKNSDDPTLLALRPTFLAVLPACLGLSITQPELMSNPGVTFFAITIALGTLLKEYVKIMPKGDVPLVVEG